MSLGCLFFHEGSPSKFVLSRWNHRSTASLIPSATKSRAWTHGLDGSIHGHQFGQAMPYSTQARKPKRGRVPSDRGSFGFGCGVRDPEDAPPFNRGSFAQDMPIRMSENRERHGYGSWVREHLLLTSKHFPDRAPLPDKGKPVVRRGRKATDQISDLTAGLPEEE